MVIGYISIYLSENPNSWGYFLTLIFKLFRFQGIANILTEVEMKYHPKSLSSGKKPKTSEKVKIIIILTVVIIIILAILKGVGDFFFLLFSNIWMNNEKFQRISDG